MDDYFDMTEFLTYEYRFFCRKNEIPESSKWISTLGEINWLLGPEMYEKFLHAKPYLKNSQYGY